MDLNASFGILLHLLFSFVWSVRGQEGSNETVKLPDFNNPTIILHLLLGNHDQRVRPNEGGPPTFIYCRVKIISMDSVTEVTMDYKMTIILEQSWHDPRMTFETLSNLSYVQTRHVEIWLPDTFFSNEKNAYVHQVTVPNRIVRILSNGTIWFSQKLTLVMSCAMDFAKFPMDRQRCTTVIESYRSTADELRLAWNEPDPVQIIKQINLPQYNFDSTNLSYGYCRGDNGIFEGEFACLEFSFILDRELAFYVVQTFLPSSLLVLMSWVSFWIDITQAPARVSLGVTIILTMTTTTTGFGSAAGLPKVSYTKAIDVWFDMCLGFVTMSLLEYALVHYLWNREMELRHIEMARRKKLPKMGILGRKKPRSETTDIESLEEYEMESKLQSQYNYSSLGTRDEEGEGFVAYNNGNTQHNMRGNDQKMGPSQLQQYEQYEGSMTKLVALKIDRVSRFIFPFSFIFACTTYWIVYNYIAQDHFETLPVGIVMDNPPDGLDSSDIPVTTTVAP